MVRIPFFSEFFSQKKLPRLKRTVYVLCGFSVFLYALTAGLSWIHGSGLLPVGFSYHLESEGGSIRGHIPELTGKRFEKAVLRLAGNRKEIKSVTFRSRVYSPAGGNHKYHVGDSKKAAFFSNGHEKRMKSHRFLNNTGLNKGFNDILIRYTFENGAPAEIRFFMKKHQLEKPLPYFYYVIPESAGSRLFFLIMMVIHMIRSWGFILSLLILVVPASGGFLRRGEPAAAPEEASGPATLPVFFFLVVTGIFAGHFLNQRLGIHLPGPVIWGLAVVIPLIVSIPRWRRMTWRLRVDRKKWLHLGIIFVMVYGYIFMMSGKLFPTEPIGGGDLGAHMEMINHFHETGCYKTDENWVIYPQSTHAFISDLSDIFGVTTEMVVAPLLSFLLFLIFSLIYLLLKHYFPDCGVWVYVAALALANHLFFYRTALVNHYFPPLVSLFFLLGAVYFLIRRHPLVSSLGVSISLIVYPFFMVMVFSVMFFPVFRQLTENPGYLMKKIRRGIIFFSLPAVFIMLYVYVYTGHGFSQVKEGFVSSAVYDPFLGMGIIFSLFLCTGIMDGITKRQQEPGVHTLFPGVMAGFVFYYAAYYLADFGTFHYLVKTMLPVIAFGLIWVSNGINQLFNRIRKQFANTS